MDINEIKELVIKAKKGDQAAIASLYEATSKAVYFTALKIVGNPSDAEDIAQDTYVTAISKLSDLKDEATFPKWIKTIAVNTAKNFMIKKKPVLFGTDEEEQDAIGNIPEVGEDFIPDEAADKKETCRLVSEIIDGLPEKQRMAVIMFYYDEMTVSEIAEVMGTNDNTIKSRLNYARKQIKEEVEELAKKGTKLYCVAGVPIVAFVLKMLATETAVPVAVAAKAGIATAAATTTATVAATTATTTTAATTAATTATASTAATAATTTAAASTAAATATTAATTAAGAGLTIGTAAKVAIAAVASVAVIGGGIVAGSTLLGNESEPAAAETTITIEMPELDFVLGDTVTENTTENVVLTENIVSEEPEIPERDLSFTNEDAENMILNYLNGTGELDYEKLYWLKRLEIYGTSIVRAYFDDVGDEYLTFDSVDELKDTFTYDGKVYKFGEIRNLDFVSGMPNLESLTVVCNSLINISALSDVQELKRLDVRLNYIKDFSVLSDKKELSHLNIYANWPENFEFLRGKNNLETLNAGKCKLNKQDVSVFSELNNLKNLYISNNEISDISFIADLTGLKKLNISGNKVSSISELSVLKDLESLNISYNKKINDISIVSGFKNLKVLNVYETMVTDITPITNLANLEEFRIRPETIHTIDHLSLAPLSGKPNMKILVIEFLPVTDISVLSEMNQMTHLILWYIGVKDYEPISKMKELVYLDLHSVCGSVDLTPLSGLEKLKSLRIEKIRDDEGFLPEYLSDITPLANLTNLEELYLNQNRTMDISSLSDLKKLRILDLGHNVIADLSPLSELINLEELNLFDNHNYSARGVIKDISALSNLTNLRTLSLAINSISDATPLYNLKNLRSLDIYGNYLSDEDIEELQKHLPNCSVD